MSDSNDDWSFVQPNDFLMRPDSEVGYMQGRLQGFIYASRSFKLKFPASKDFGLPARFIYKILVEADEASSPSDETEEHTVATTPGGRRQLKLLVSREAGRVKELWIQKVSTSGGGDKLETLLHLDRQGASKLIDLVRAMEQIPVEGQTSVRVDDGLVRDLFADPSAMQKLYQRDPTRFRQLIQDDSSARDLLALAHRREQLTLFRRLLTDAEFFDSEKAAAAGSSERVWQRFLEANPWILGVSLAGQLLTAWDEHKLEQTVAGFSIGGAGKRSDALLRTAGQIRSMVFAEIKHHKTPLLESNTYRPGCWPPHAELVGGVTQVQQTLHRANQQLGDLLLDRDETDALTGAATYLLRPRSFLIIGHLDQLKGAAGVQPERYQSFELYRRNLYEPEVLTFDELLARAEWHVSTAESEAQGSRTSGI